VIIDYTNRYIELDLIEHVDKGRRRGVCFYDHVRTHP